MFCKPPLFFGKTWRNAESKALLPQQGISSIATTERHNLSTVGDVSNERQVWIAGPVIDQGL